MTDLAVICTCACCQRWRAEIRAITIAGIRIAMLAERGDATTVDAVALMKRCLSDETWDIIDATAAEAKSQMEKPKP